MVPSFLTCIRPVEFVKFFPQKEHLKVFGVSVDSLPYLLRFSFSFAEHKNVIKSDWAFDVPSNDTPFVSSFQHSHSNLDDLTGDASAADDLCYFSRY